MARVLTDSANYTAIADAIRAQLGTSDTYLPSEMADAIASIEGGGGSILSGITAPTSDMGENGQLYKRVFPLPSNIDFVDYLESSGTQYIDTGIVADGGTDLRAVMRYPGNTFMIGSRRGSWNRIYNSLYIGATGDHKIGLAKHGGNSSSDFIDTNDFIATVQDGIDYILECKSRRVGTAWAVMFSIEQAGTSVLSTLNVSGSISESYTQILFGLNDNGTRKISSGLHVSRVTYRRDRIPIADYIPCLDQSGVACMWDNVAGEYVYNDGTGDFAHGSAVTPTEAEPVLYVKVNGAWEMLTDWNAHNITA